jgi:hypothetical protein
MKPIVLLPVALLFLGSVAASQQVKSFRDEQFRYPRVRLAAKEKDDALRHMFEEKRISYPPRAILFRAFKKEALLELWASENAENSYALVHTYAICATSGVLGPKRKFGDVQVPEGSTNSIGSTRRAIFSLVCTSAIQIARTGSWARVRIRVEIFSFMEIA